MSPNFSKGDRLWVCRQHRNVGNKTCPYWHWPYEVVAKKAHDVYVIQVDQWRLGDIHADCLMKTVKSPRSTVPLRYTEEIPRVPSQFEVDSYNVKKYGGTINTAIDLSSMCDGTGTLGIVLLRSPGKRWYLPTTGCGDSI